MTRRSVSSSREGFTLIEVLGALVVFSVGVLLVVGLVGSLSTQMNRASTRGQVAVSVQNSLDSMQAVPYDSLSVGTVTSSLTLNGRAFTRTERVLQSSAVVRELEVTLSADDGQGPDLTASAFVSRIW